VFPTIMTASVFQLNFSLTQATQTVNDDDDIDYDEKTATGRTRNRPAAVFTLSLIDPEWRSAKSYIVEWDKGTTNSE